VFQNGFSPRRVVVTGMGIACPLGLGVEHVWKRMLAGESGIGSIQSFDTSALPAKIAGQVPAGEPAQQRAAQLHQLAQRAAHRAAHRGQRQHREHGEVERHAYLIR
jgi:3-oxoacyl-(acyl-carrier-protein) synthase